MVGEQVQEMQQANWISTTALNIPMPEWMNLWFGVFPTAESLGSQLLAAILVIGSYFLARRVCVHKRQGDPRSAATACIVPDCTHCDIPQATEEEVRPVHVTIRSTAK
jgi:high-affinity iron transporter